MLGWLSCFLLAFSSAAEERPHLLISAKGDVAGYADTDSVAVFTPSVESALSSPTSGWEAGAGYLVDVVSAASVDVVSSATPRWEEVRHVVSAHGSYQPRTVGGNLAASISSEPDYLSLSASAGMLAELSEKNVVALGRYGYSLDRAGRTGTPFELYSLDLHRHTLGGGAELVLDRSSVLTLFGDLIYETGRQEKPYRFLPLFAVNVAPEVPVGASPGLVQQLRLPAVISERLPTQRFRAALSGQLRRRFDTSTLQASERLYADDWGLVASTTDARVILNLAPRIEVWPHFRFHLQSAAVFWKRAYVGTLEPSGVARVPALRTGDRELSPLWTGTLGGGVRWYLGRESAPSSWALVAQLDGAHTSFGDALYITQRQAVFGSLRVEARLP